MITINTRDTILLKKAEKVLKDNIYPKDKFPWGQYSMISPGRGHFLGIWNWDSAFHAIGMLEFDHTLAKDQILGFLKYQKQNGMLPDVIWENGKITDGWTKPPVMAYAAKEVYKATGDSDFLVDVYPKLILNEQFWVNERFYNGLFHYDAERIEGESEADYYLHVGYESGWDNSPRWDNEPQNCWPVDLNCYMVMTYEALEFMAKELCVDFVEWKVKREVLVQNIEKTLWNNELNAYTDYNFKKNCAINVLSPAAFMPLFVGIATKERAEYMNSIAQKHFLPGMPTIAYDDPSYSNNYWRGPCWLNVAYFAAKGLYDYGYTHTALTVKETILNWVYEDGDCIHENYNAKSGEGLCHSHFSWSSIFVRKFISDIV